MTSEEFPYILRLDTLSTACVNAIANSGPLLARDQYGGRVFIDGSDGIHDSTPGPAFDCLSAEAKARETAHHGQARLYTPGQSPAFRPPNGLRLNCCDLATAVQVNAVLAGALLPTGAELDKDAEDIWLWVFGDYRDNPEPDCSSYIYLHGGCAEQPTWTLDGRSDRCPHLSRLPDLMSRQVPATDEHFWGRVRVLAVLALDAAGIFTSQG